ncbi:MAG: M15 family metallopeptidase [Phyllobacteriaceae bacterium]|nr:M15 family metallopeptidase [Phyllobacteriaceae bacterium]
MSKRVFVCVLASVALAPFAAAAEGPGEKLAAAYPGFVDRVEGGELVMKSGARLKIDDGRTKTFEQRLADPDLDDMFADPYPAAGSAATAPGKDVDPGRYRTGAFFDAVYGDCRKGEVKKHLVQVAWVPKWGGGKVAFSSRAGAAEALAAVSKELEAGPPEWKKFLVPSAGTYNCRVIAGTDRVSAHGWGIAVDVATKYSDYWYWSDPSGRKVAYKNRIPVDIAAVFERHGFVWGARWYHYDTMHFEYRPEMLR